MILQKYFGYRKSIQPWLDSVISTEAVGALALQMAYKNQDGIEEKGLKISIAEINT
jgi:hypothetical protein